MKNSVTLKWLSVLVFSLLIWACTSDEDTTPNVDSQPVFTELNEELRSLPGEIIFFRGTIQDPAGIEFINLKYDNWFLDRTIRKDSLPTEYVLDYQFIVPEDEVEGSTHEIEVTATNVGGVSTSQTITVTLNADLEAPMFSINSPTNNSSVLIGPGNEIDFNITVTDLDLNNLTITGSLLNEDIALSGTTYTYTNSLDVSNAGTYTFTIGATDTSGNQATETITVNVIDTLTFNEMYITNVTDPAALTTDLFGIPALTENSTVPGETGFVFTGKFYADQPNTEVRFIPVNTTFSPFTFGADPSNSGVLLLGSDETVNPIVLPQVGYYEVEINLLNLSYTVTPYTPTDTPFNQVYIIGRGITIGNTNTCTSNANGSTLCWNFGSGKPFVADANNVYRWTLDLTLEDQPNDAGENGFILNANPAGWSPFWRFDNGVSPNATVPNGGTNYVFPDSAFGDYTFVFDTHLNRLTAQSR